MLILQSGLREQVRYTPFEVGAMRKVDHIEEQIRQLTGAEFAELRDWILELDGKTWDAQIERDARAGKLDSLVSEAKWDYAAGRSKPL